MTTIRTGKRTVIIREGNQRITVTAGGGGESLPPLVTTEALTIPVDYNDVTAVDPPTGVRFANQMQWDDHLSSQGATNYKHVQKVADALPTLVHAVVVNCASGIHRPSALGETNLNTTVHLEGGSLSILGDPTVASWTSIHAGGTITGHQTLDEVTSVPDPYLDFAASTFPNDGSLRGKYAVLDNGFISVIWDHTDSRLWVCKKLAPVPTDGVTTAFVAEPSTIFRSSMDDIVTSKPFGVPIDIIARGLTDTFVGIIVNDIDVQGFGNNFIDVFFDYPFGIVVCNGMHIDKTTGPNEEGPGLGATNDTSIVVQDFSFLTTIGGGGDVSLSIDSSFIQLIASYIQGGDDGAQIFGTHGYFRMIATVVRGAGGDAGGNPGIIVFDGAGFGVVENGSGVRNTILETQGGGAAFEFRGRGMPFEITTFSNVLRFRDNTGPCLRLGDSALVNIPLGDGFLDDGGNLDVGIEFVGTYVRVDLPAATDVTGTNGDVRFAGAIKTYANIVANSPVVDIGNFNRVTKA